MLGRQPVNNAPAPDIEHSLDAWREQGADRLDPARFHLIQAMANRASKLAESDAKRFVAARLTELADQYAARVEAARAVSTPPLTNSGAPSTAPRSALTGLLKHVATLTAPLQSPAPSHSVARLRERYPELALLDEFRATWSRVSANRQVRQSEAQVHENAGPLNSSHLVHRALSMMRDASPGYLHQFLSYLDALAWVEQLHMSNEPPAKETKRAAAKSTKPAKRGDSPKRTQSTASSPSGKSAQSTRSTKSTNSTKSTKSTTTSRAKKKTLTTDEP